MNASALSAQSLHEALAAGARRDGSIVGRRIEFHSRIESTNDRARDLAASGEPEGTVVVADEQTRGRGRSGGSWHSPPGLGLYVSVILRPTASADSAPLFGLLAAVAVASSVRARIKWPNDLLIDGRKLAGILTEGRSTQDAIKDIVIGIGINVNHTPADFPAELAGRAGSLRMARGAIQDRVAVAAQLLAALDASYALWNREGDATIVTAYSELATGLNGRRVLVTGGPRPWTGITDGITSEGALRVRPTESGGAGDVAEIRYGDVLHLEDETGD